MGRASGRPGQYGIVRAVDLLANTGIRREEVRNYLDKMEDLVPASNPDLMSNGDRGAVKPEMQPKKRQYCKQHICSNRNS